MILKFQEPVNILKADTKDVGGVARGEMILGLSDNKEIARQQIQYLEDRGLAVEDITGFGDAVYKNGGEKR
jgi:D-methionine transport system ATP-binding protein